MNDSPFFSIIVPIYNREKQLEKTLDSVKAQTFTSYELILIDDCSKDKSFEVALKYDIPNKIVARNPVNKERCYTRNEGIKIARGRYICFLDSDDKYLPNHLEILYSEIKNRNFPVAMFFTNSYLENENGEIVPKIVPTFNEKKKFAYLLKYTPNPARVCVEKSIFNEIKFDLNIPGIEDLDAWLHIATKYPIYHIEKYTNIYYVHSESYTKGDSKRHEKELKYFKYVFKKPELRKHLPLISRNRLLSNSHYHLAVKAEMENASKRKILYHALTSFILYPKGYNPKIPKSLLTIILYNLPLVGSIIKKIYRKAIKRS